MSINIKKISKKYESTFLRIAILFFLSYFLTGSISASPSEEVPMAARVALDKANKLMTQKEYDKAIEILTSFQAQGKKLRKQGKKKGSKGYHHPMVYFFIGNCFLMKTDYASAQKYYTQSVEGDPGFVGAWLNLARTNYELHNYTDSAKCFGNAYEKSDPKIPDSLYYCALGYLMDNRYDTSVTVFQRLFKDHPDAITLKWKENYVRALTGAGRAKEALPIIKELAEKLTGEEKSRWQEMLWLMKPWLMPPY